MFSVTFKACRHSVQQRWKMRHSHHSKLSIIALLFLDSIVDILPASKLRVAL